MTIGWPAVTMVLGSVAGAVWAALAVRVAPGELLVENRAGELVPAVLGWALVAGVVTAASLPWLWWTPPDDATIDTVVVGAFATTVVHAAGFVDDWGGGGPRGLRGHVGSLARGRPTTGILKLVVGIGAGVGLGLWAGGSGTRIAASAVLIAVAINVWNALDVVPGRALKWAAVALVALLSATRTEPYGILAGAALGAVAAVLPFDLLRRGMLGDAGSNPLGLLVGLGLALALPTWGVVAAAVAFVLLQVAAETVTISRVIDAVPPLRWFDRLGRRPDPT